MTTKQLVAIIGAGPAGLFMAKELTDSGAAVVLINRDIKPGGLLEYGVFPTKHKFKNGLRKQFRETLAKADVYYRGNVDIGEQCLLSHSDIEAMGFDAIVLAVGAQGTKSLGITGENSSGVYHAKDLVYHYNRLPPFSNRHVEMGRRVIVIGVGNVMVDIAHWLNEFLNIDEVIAISRTVPRFRKWSNKELKTIRDTIDSEAITNEIERIRQPLIDAGEDPDEDLKSLLKYAGPDEQRAKTRWWVQWLVQPAEIMADSEGKVTGLKVSHLKPQRVEGGGRPKVRPTGKTSTINADTVVFAVGDSVDLHYGLPANAWGFRTESELFEGGDPYRVLNADGTAASTEVFTVGWARVASSGLVGTARKDTRVALKHITAFLNERSAPSETVAARLERLDSAITVAGRQFITKAHAQKLEEAELARLELESEDPRVEGRFISNQAMLDAIFTD